MNLIFQSHIPSTECGIFEATGLSKEEKQNIVDQHNLYRTFVARIKDGSQSDLETEKSMNMLVNINIRLH